MLCDCHKSGKRFAQADGDCHKTEHANAMFDQVKDLADRIDRLHRERQAEADRLRAELERARRPW